MPRALHHTACSQLHNCNCSAARQKQAAGYGRLQLLFEGDTPVQARMTIKRMLSATVPAAQAAGSKHQAAGSKQQAAGKRQQAASKADGKLQAQ